MKHQRILLVALALFYFVPLLAQVPRIMNYQGKLTDASGVAIHDADRTIAFLVYDSESGGSPIWAETLTVNIVNGLFDVQLGCVHPFDIAFDDTYWIELKIDQNDDGDVMDITDEFLTPRERLAPVAYAYRSIYATGTDSAIQSVSTDENTTGRVGHLRFIPYEGSSVTESASNDTIFIAITGGSGCFKQLRADAGAWLTDSVTLVQGTNITLTQTGDSITVSSTGSSSDDDWQISGDGTAPDTVYNLYDHIGIGVNNPNNLIQVSGLINFDNAKYTTSLGYQAGQANTANYNTFIGYRAGYSLSNATAAGNVYIGYFAGDSRTSGDNNVFIGQQAGRYGTGGRYNTFVGACVGEHNNGSGNVFIGHEAGLNNENGNNNVFIGRSAGINSSGSGNIFIGYGAGYNETGSNKLYIDNTNTDTPLIYGDFATDILTVNGQIKITGGAPGEGKVLTSDADGLATWETPTGGSDDDWTRSGNKVYTYNTIDSVGIGTTNPQYKLHVAESGPGYAIHGSISGSSGSNVAIYGYATSSGTNSIGVYGYAYGATSTSNTGVDGTATGSSYRNVGVRGYVYGSTAAENEAVRGQTDASSIYNYAFYAWASGSGTNNWGLYANVYNATGTNYGVSTNVHGSTTNYGIYSSVSGGTTNYSGYFTGGVLKIPDFTDETGLTTGEGNMFWDSDDDVLYVHNGSAWQEVGGGSGIPSGGIIMYSGPWNFDDTGLGTGPLVGWALCNGNNGTPDLSDRFVMGTVSSPTPGGTGGSTTHTHSIPNLNLKNNAGSSSSELGIYDPGDSGQRICWKNGWQNPSCAARDAGSYGYTSRFGTASATTGSASSLPPYIKLAFIMKL